MASLAAHYQIRTARLKDVDTMVRLWQAIDKAGEPRPFGGDTFDKAEHAKKIITHALDSAQAVLLVCTYNDSLIGTISGHVFEKPAVKLNPIGVIYSLWVDTAHRNQGVGQYLLNTLETSLKDLGAQAIQVGWDSANRSAEQWWQRRGYQAYEIIASKVL